MDRHWFISWTTYGSRVAGDAHGFVSNVAAVDGGREVRHNAPDTDCDRNMPRLEQYVRARMLDKPVELLIEQAEAMVAQYLETTRIREFELHAAAVMMDHTHMLVGVPGDPDPEHLRELYKSWATRALKKQWELPRSGTFFTKGGSVRKKADEAALKAAVIYVAMWPASSQTPWSRTLAIGGEFSLRNSIEQASECSPGERSRVSGPITTLAICKTPASRAASAAR